MSLYCRYHVLEIAEWRCPQCSIDYCGICSPDPVEDEGPVPHKCPHCKATLLALGGAHNAPPFWQQLMAFLRYPFSLIGGGLMLLGFLLPLLVPQGMLLHMVRLAFLVGITLYLWAAFEAVASGKLEPIKPLDLVKALGKPLAVYLGFMLVVMALLASYVLAKDRFVGTVVTVLLLGMLPALLIGVGLNRSVGSGFSKDGVIAVLRGVGPVYAAVFLLPVLLLAGLQAFVGLFADVLPVVLGQALAMVAYTYLAIVVFALSGYVLFQYQEELNYTPEGGTAKRKQYKKGDPVQLQVEMYLKDGSYGKAVSLLKADALDKKMATLSQHERYQKLIWVMGQEEQLRAHATPYFKQLLQAGRGIQVAGLLRDYTQRYPDFKVGDPEVRLDMAQAFEQQGDYKLAVHVLNGLHKDHPHYPGLPIAYLLAARLLAEKLNLPQKALALVEFLHGRYRNHRSFAEINQMRSELMQQLSPPGPA